MKKYIITVAIIMAASASVSAQGFLKGLKEAVGNELSKGVMEAKEAVNSSRESVGSVLGGDKNAAKKYGVVKPSTAKNAIELLNDLPDFPTAARIAENEDAFRNFFYDQIYAVENRMNELMEANCVNQNEDDERVQMNLAKRMTGGADLNATMAEALASIDVEAIQKAAEKGDISALMKLSENAARVSESMSANVNTNGLDDMYVLENDKNFAALAAKIADLSPEYMTEDAGKLKESETLASINAGFKKIWAEKDNDTVKQLYAQVNDSIEQFELIRAQARLDQNARMKGQYEAMIAEAEMIASAYTEESLVARYAMNNLPLAVVEAYKDLLYDVWNSSDDIFASDAVVPVQMTRIKLPLQAGDVICQPESSIYQMLDDQELNSVYGLAKDAENVEEAFLSKAVFLVKNSNDGKFYKIQGDSRTPLGSKYDKSFDFSQRYTDKERAELRIRMKSLDKKTLTFNKHHTLFIPIPESGRYYDVLAIQRTEDWIAFITLDSKGDFYKCLFRL